MTNATVTAVLHHPGVLAHDTGKLHPEQPRRVSRIMDALKASAFRDRLTLLSPTPAKREQIAAAHDAEYLELIEREVGEGRRYLSTGDTHICPASLAAAALAAGAAAMAVDLVVTKRAANAFCVMRPPGHHASAQRGMGFCLINNAAVAVEQARREHGMERVLVVDWDVHHGNGTQDAYYADPNVLVWSVHMSPGYPGTGGDRESGAGPGEGATINCPLPHGSTGAEVGATLSESLIPAAERFRPELVIVSCGFDARREDPLGRFQLEDADFLAMTQRAMDIADHHCDGRLISLLEGGYNLTTIGRAAEAHVAGLCGATWEPAGGV